MADEEEEDGEEEAEGEDEEGEEEDDEEDEEEQDTLPGGWEGEEQRATCLKNLQPEAEPDERQQALVELRDLATMPEHQEALWRDDKELREALLYCIEPPNPDYGKSLFVEETKPVDDLSRIIAMSVVVSLAGSTLNRHVMNVDKTLRTCVVCSTDEDRPQPLKDRAFLVLSHLALSGGVKEAGGDQFESDKELAAHAAQAEEDLCGICEGCGLEKVDCVCNAGKEISRSSDQDALDALCLGGAQGQPEIVRSQVMGSLWTLAAQSTTDAEALWGVPKLREMVLTSAALGEPMMVRMSALGAIWALALADWNKEKMWQEARLRSALIAGSSPDMPVDVDDESAGRKPQPPEMRLKALGALLVLAGGPPNREAIWGDGRVASMLIRTAGAANRVRRIRAAALAVMVELSKCWDNSEPMSAVGADALLAEAAGDESFSVEERRDCGFGHARLLQGVNWTR